MILCGLILLTVMCLIGLLVYNFLVAVLLMIIVGLLFLVLEVLTC